MEADSESRVSLMDDLQFEFHHIIRNFPACVSHFAVLRTLFIEYRVRVVYVNQDPAAPHSRVRHLKQTARSRKRYVPDFASRFRPNACGNQFVLIPERSVEQTKIARSRPVLPFLSAPWKSGGVKGLLASL